MIQAIGLTSARRRDGAPVVDDLTFEAGPGAVTGLLGAAGSGKSAALRLMLELEPGRGVTLFGGRPLHRIRRPAHAVGVLLGDAYAHPGRSARSHLRMLCAAGGIPGSRADEVLDLVGLAEVARGRLDAFSLGMERRLGLAAALLGDPHMLVLDEPAVGLSPRESAWVRSLLKAFAAQGGTVLVAGADAKKMAALADHVVSIDHGRLVADQPAETFARTRLRPRVVVRSPHAPRLAGLLAAQGIEVAKESGSCVGVFGSDRSHIGETAFRHGIVLHELADQVIDSGPPVPVPEPELFAADILDPWTPEGVRAAGAPGGTGLQYAVAVAAATGTALTTTRSALTAMYPAPAVAPVPQGAGGGPADAVTTEEAVTARDHVTREISTPGRGGPVRSALPGPTWLMRYEWRRLAGIRSTWLITAVALAADLVVVLGLGRGVLASGGHGGYADVQRLLVAWLPGFPLPPVALGAGVLGALAFGHEFRYPALAPAQVAPRRRLRLLLAKLVVSAACALLLAGVALVLNAAVVRYGVVPRGQVLPDPLLPALLPWGALVVGCAWTGLLAAGVFRSSLAGALCVLAVPVLAAPAVRWSLRHPLLDPALRPARRGAASLADGWGGPLERAVSAAGGGSGPGPVAYAFTLCIAGLLCAYVFLAMRRRTVGRAPGKLVSFR